MAKEEVMRVSIAILKPDDFQNDGPCVTYQICLGNQIIGKVWLTTEDLGYAIFISCFNIVPLYQGNGYGKQIMEKIFLIAQEKGCKKLRLYVNVDNQRAVNLYLRFGFKITGRVCNGGHVCFSMKASVKRCIDFSK